LFVPLDRVIVRVMSDERHGVHERTIETRSHGRYLVSPGSGREAPLLVGFHGYGETAEEEMGRLRAIPGSASWIIVCVQGLHQFYRRRTNDVVASWMTRQNRELAIADNIEYVSRIVRSVSEEFTAGPGTVVTGFSQGAAMAYRAAVTLDRAVAGVIACGGDVPPELEAKALARIPRALLGRGLKDEWYSAEKLASDEQRLRDAGVSAQIVALDAAHEWTPEFDVACGRFLQTSLADKQTRQD